MLKEFWFNVKIGLNHILDINGYDHVLFLIVLAVPFLFKDWKRVLLMVSIFTLGHSASLVLGAYGYVKINKDIVEFLIPLTILITALYNILSKKKKTRTKTKNWLVILTTLSFGLIHGFGFAREFQMIADNSMVFLVEFALGIEIAQVIIVLVILFLGTVLQNYLRVAKRDWIMVSSSIVVGLAIPMLLNSSLFSA